MGEYLSTPIKEKFSSNGENSFIRYGCSFMQGWRKRMEDAHIMDMDIGPNKDTQLFAVFDGHGGKEVAVFVGNHFTEEFLKSEGYQKGDIKLALEQTYRKMDQLMLEEPGRSELVEIAKESRKEEVAKAENAKKAEIEALREPIDPKFQPGAKISMFTGCTAIVMCLHKDKFYFANAGDSRAILVKKGELAFATRDHKTSSPREIARIEKAGGWISDDRIMGNINLSRGLGDAEYKMNKKLKPHEQIVSNLPDITILPFDKDCDFVVVACDGIWDCKTSQECAEYFRDKLEKLKPGQPLSSLIEVLLDDICAADVYNEKGVGCDNMSCILIQFKQSIKKH